MPFKNLLTKNKTRIPAIILILVLALGMMGSFDVPDTYAASATITISGHNQPGALKKGKTFSVKGTIKSNVTIKRVEIGIVNSAGNRWIYRYDNKKVNAKSFNVHKADSQMKFSKLPNGSYYYRMWVHTTNGVVKMILNKAFTVGNVSTTAATPTTNTASISGHNYPTSLEAYNTFSVKGTVKDSKKLTRVEVGIVNAAGTGWIYRYDNKKVNATSFSIKTADAAMKFSKLAPGSYYYRIWAHDAGGAKMLLNAPFTVKETFEGFMNTQGFPDSYKPYLRRLHQAHPTWKFYAQKTNVTWDYAVSKEFSNGDNYVGTNDPWYLKVNTAIQDGKWNQATKKTIAYYMDPRNFLTEQGIYQFLDQRNGQGTGNSTNLSRLFGSSTCSWNTSSYINWINAASTTYGVKPNVMGAMIIMEQGWKGANNSLVSGTYDKTIKAPMNNVSLKGYYNFFNIGAYGATLKASETGSSSVAVNSTERGLWYAAGQPRYNKAIQATSYGRPWNTKEKAISGGIQFYTTNYINKNQYTYYTKKFNVVPAAGVSFASHQYMTNVAGANDEGALLRRSYTNGETDLVFRIPVYNSMPASNCPLPTEKNH